MVLERFRGRREAEVREKTEFDTRVSERDFWFGVIGLGGIAILAILLEIFS
jgi:hypothetical protein